MRKGEWINKVRGWVDEYVSKIEFQTNLGKTWSAGVEKEHCKEPQLDSAVTSPPYVFGLNAVWGLGTLGGGLKELTPLYVDLDQVPSEIIPFAPSWNKCIKKAELHGSDGPAVDHEDM